MPLLINSLITQKTPQKRRRGRPLLCLISFLLVLNLFSSSPQFPSAFFLLSLNSLLPFSLFSFLLIFSLFLLPHFFLFSTPSSSVPSLLPHSLFHSIPYNILLWSLSSFILFSSSPPSLSPPPLFTSPCVLQKYLPHLLSFSMQKANMQRRLSPVASVCRLTRPAFSLTVIPYIFHAAMLSAMKLKEHWFYLWLWNLFRSPAELGGIKHVHCIHRDKCE